MAWGLETPVYWILLQNSSMALWLKEQIMDPDAKIQISALPLISHANLDKLFNLSGTQFPHL